MISQKFIPKADMKFFFYSAFLFVCLSQKHVFSQPAKEDVISMFSSTHGGGKKVVSLDSLTESQRKFLSENTTEDFNGFLNVLVTDEYISEIANFNPKVGFKLLPDDKNLHIEEDSFLGSRKESKFRTMYLFGNKGSVHAMATRWDFKADGASIVAVDEYLNSNIFSLRGTLSRVTGPSSTAVIWKYSGSSDSVFYEITLVEPFTEPSTNETGTINSKIEKYLNFLSSIK